MVFIYYFFFLFEIILFFFSFQEYEWTSQFLDSFTNDFSNYSTNTPKPNNNFSASIIRPPSNQQIQIPPHAINDFNIQQHSQWMPWNEQSYT
jgi:hypothetical protein